MRYKYFVPFIFLFFCSLESVFALSYDQVAIFVNDQVITKNEIELRTLEVARQNPNSSEEDLKRLKSEVKAQLVEYALLEARAKDLGIVIDDDQLDEEVEQFIKQRSLGKFEFEELLEQQQMNLSGFKRNFRKQLTRNRIIGQEVRSKIQIDDSELEKKYLEIGSSDFKIRARHILIQVSEQTTQNEAIEKINSLKDMILEGRSFTEVAREHSEDPSVKTNFGDLGFFNRNEMVPQFSDVAYSLPLNTLSDPVVSPFGVHLIEVLEKKEASKQPFAEVRKQLYQKAYEKQYQNEYKSYIDDLKQKAKITFR